MLQMCVTLLSACAGWFCCYTLCNRSFTWLIAYRMQQTKYIVFTLLLIPAVSFHPVYHDYCILGAGPGGLQAARFLKDSGRDYVVLERNQSPGSFFLRFPRHRKLISINKKFTGRKNREFNLRHDWNSLLSQDRNLLFGRYSSDFFPHADDMLRYLQNFSAGIHVHYGVNISRIQLKSSSVAWNGHFFFLLDQAGRAYQCSVLLVATGLSLPHLVDFPGSEYAEGYETVSTDPHNFMGQSVLILGRGNSAFETAENILGVTNFIHMLGRSRVRLSWATHYVGDLRAINNGLLDTYQLKSLDGLLEGDLSDLALVRDEAGKVYVSHRHYLRRDTEPAGNKTGITLSTLPQDDLDNFAAREPYDRVIRCLGWSFDFSIFDRSVKLKPATKQNRKYPWLTASYEARYTRGLFVVGTASHAIDFRQSAGGFIHGFRYTARAAHRLMEKRYHHVPWPVTHHPTSQLLNVLLRRLNEASGLYQMFGVLADVVIIGEDSQHFQYLEEVPAGILPDFEQSTGREVHDTGLFVLTMEYGKNFSGPDKDVFYYDRAIGEARAAWQSNFLHPVVYYYRQLPTEQQMKLRPEHWPLPRPDRIHHVVEDFLTDWTGPNAHVLPLRRFLENCLQMDLRAFYAESCFLFALTHRKLPIFCQQGYLRDQGLTGTEQLRLLSIEAGLMEDYKSRSHVASFERPHQGSTRDEL
ncbi:FAD-dependent oxidoreductase domain-containing protein 2 isoform X2 [Bombina bombina]|uniref:FAD-dependent oxidoreductase domain-containing protein 2 isoform X2 n=1 Tax=Bombina bombina TaxID=8345 RepID=UPI00235A80BD|nr:FAD-dependent oxidoreductase domain-containing protein 2 isoform X2 [Bombina bombina]